MTDQSAPQPMLAQPKPCGECGLCCKVMATEELDKPDGEWCPHFGKGRGCTIHASRPQSCRDYACIWTVATALDDSWRPDRAGFVIAPGLADEIVLHVDADDPGSWRREPYYSTIKRWTQVKADGFKLVLVRCDRKVTAVFQHVEIDLGPDQPDKVINAGYASTFAGPKPFARFVDRSQMETPS